jgi:hypothetical protein
MEVEGKKESCWNREKEGVKEDEGLAGLDPVNFHYFPHG